jgi:uncharacterized repeat protein (TIGR01451 family)
MKPDHNRNRLRDLLFACAGGSILVCMLLGGSSVAWARPDAHPDYQTVPTLPPTSVRPPAATPTSAPATVPSGVNLELQFRASTTMAVPGQIFQYWLVIHNAGEDPSGTLIVRAPIPDELELVGVSVNSGQQETGDSGVVVTLESLAGGADVQIELTVRVREDTPLGTVIENNFELELAGAVMRSEIVAVTLPPAALPRTGGPAPKG